MKMRRRKLIVLILSALLAVTIVITALVYIILDLQQTIISDDELTKSSPKDNETIVITIANGKIRGANNGTFWSFRGIPLAKPPVGNLRFEAPVKPDNWSGIKDCIAEPDSCLQQRVIEFVDSESEDCLFMNVYTPKLPNENHSTSLLPVMVWIYGGSFIEGNSTFHFYSPEWLISQGVVVAMFNYRLGVFGFFSTGDMIVPGNAGMKDQVLALKWVQENIAAFGGDPAKVTVFGESAGSISVHYHLASPHSQGLFRGAIMQSGTSLSTPGLSRYPKKVMMTLADKSNITIETTQNFVNHLKKLDYQTLQNIASACFEELYFEFLLEGLGFAPVVEPEHDGAFFTGKSYEIFAAGNFSRIPVIIGFNSLEGQGFVTDAVRQVLAQGDSRASYLVPVDANVLPKRTDAAGKKIREFYWKSERSIFLADPLIATHFVGDFHFIRPIDQTVFLQSKFATVFYYKFSYKPDSSNFTGVPHTHDCYYIFKNNKLIVTQLDFKVARMMTKMWTNFAKTLNPTPEADELFGNVTWPTAGHLANGSLSFLEISSILRPAID